MNTLVDTKRYLALLEVEKQAKILEKTEEYVEFDSDLNLKGVLVVASFTPLRNALKVSESAK